MRSTRPRRARNAPKLRNIAFLVDETDGLLRDPHSLSEAALLRLHGAWSRGFDALITTALNESSRKDAGSQWQILRPILAEAEAPEAESYPVRERLPGRPRRLSRPRPGITMRRERTADGYTIHITGSEAHGYFIDHIFETIERLCGDR